MGSDGSMTRNLEIVFKGKVETSLIKEVEWNDTSLNNLVDP